MKTLVIVVVVLVVLFAMLSKFDSILCALGVSAIAGVLTSVVIRFFKPA